MFDLIRAFLDLLVLMLKFSISVLTNIVSVLSKNDSDVTLNDEKSKEILELEKNATEQQKNDIAEMLGVGVDFLSEVLPDFLKNKEENQKEHTKGFYGDSYFTAILKRFAQKNKIDLSNIHFMNPITVNQISEDRLAKNLSNIRFKNKNGITYELGPLPSLTLEQKNIFVIPVNLNNTHWNMAIVDRQAKKIFYFEPLGPTEEHMSCYSAQQLLKQHLQKNDNFEVVTNKGKFQNDGHNCGPLSLQFALGFITNTSNSSGIKLDGLGSKIETTFLSHGLPPSSSQNEFRNESSEALGQTIRKYHLTFAKEVAEDIHKVLNPSQIRNTAR